MSHYDNIQSNGLFLQQEQDNDKNFHLENYLKEEMENKESITDFQLFGLCSLCEGCPADHLFLFLPVSGVFNGPKMVLLNVY